MPLCPSPASLLRSALWALRAVTSVPGAVCRVAYSDNAADGGLSVVALEGGSWRYKGVPGFSLGFAAQVWVAASERTERMACPIPCYERLHARVKGQHVSGGAQ